MADTQISAADEQRAAVPRDTTRETEELVKRRDAEFLAEIDAKAQAAQRAAATLEASGRELTQAAFPDGVDAWQQKVRQDMSRWAELAKLAREAHPRADSDLQLLFAPYPHWRTSVSPGEVCDVFGATGEARVGLGLYFTTGAVGSLAEFGKPFRLGGFGTYEIRGYLDYNFDWWFTTALGSADSQGYLQVVVDELHGGTWRNLLFKRYQLWSDETGSAGSDQQTVTNERRWFQERFAGRPDADYNVWIGCGATIQTQFQASSQANLDVLARPIGIERV